MRGSHVLTRSMLVALSLMAATTAMSGGAGAVPPPAPPEDGPAKVDDQVLAAVEDGGTTTFWVRLAERADLSAATAIDDWAERGAYVVEQLRATADVSQAAVRAELDASGARYTSYWVTNAVRVRGDEALVNELADLPSVDAILAPVTYELPEPTEVTENRVNAVEWGIARINADDVWSEVGVRGEGIIVANIDSGVQYDHPALVRQYRGNTGGGTFDHNYNWFDPTGVCGSPSTTPCDNNGHGTHTMGTMVGDDGAGNQIGVAPGARWIAVKGCETNNRSDAFLLAAGQFVMAPTDLTGANPRPDLRPHIVNNSWGGGPSDPWYADIVRAWRAGGIYPQFSTGNSGPSCGSAGSPGDYVESYAAGAFDINSAIAGFSSRGQSAFGGIKPDIAAPGVNIRSSVPGSAYGNFYGTSMASPHVAGTVALMWSASPAHVGNLEATTDILDTTAHDVSDLQCGGTATNNNVWGEGTLDVLAAVELAQDGTPGPVAITGTVTDGSGHGWPLYARVDIAGHPDSPVFTDPQTGRYSVELLEHRTYQLTATAVGPGYRPAVRTVTAELDATTQDFGLGIDASCVAAGYATAAAAPYLTEAFESTSIPAGWTVVNRTPSGGWEFTDPGQRGNLTGGTGGFAMIDSDFRGIGNSQDTDLITPPLDLSVAVAPTVSFHSDYRAFPNSTVDVDFSVDGGAAWTTLWHETTTNRRGPRVETIAIPAAGAANVLVRFRYRGTWAWWWEVDDVVVRDACAAVPGGLVVGTVSDIETGAAIDGASVTSDDAPADTAMTGPTPDDPNLGDGFYTLFSSLTGSHPFTAQENEHRPSTAAVNVAADDVVRHDFVLRPAVGLSIANAAVGEPDAGTTPLVFRIAADLASTAPVTVVVKTADGTATAPSDYTALPAAGQTVTFAPGETTRTVSIPVVGDLRKEPNETFTVSLSRPTGAVIDDGSAVGTITNDDTCTIVGTAGSDTLVGTAGDDEICGLGGNDTLSGGGGNDTLRGDAGDDELNGQADNDRFDGGAGTDRGSWAGSPAAVAVDLGRNRASGWGADRLLSVENAQGSGHGDTIVGGAGVNVVLGNGGADVLKGLAGNDRLDGGAGNDRLNGHGGNDLVHGRDGRDVVHGGPGNDNSPGGATAGVHGGPGVDTIDGGTGTDWCSPRATGETRTRCEVP